MKRQPRIPVCCSLSILLLLTLEAGAQSISGTINGYYQVNSINNATNTITVGDATGLSPGTQVLLIQMKGATIDASNSSNFGNLSSLGSAGLYELNSICGVSGNQVILQNQFLNSYDVNGALQLVTIPVYASVTVSDTLRAKPWDRTLGTGGVLVLEASDSIYLQAPIDVRGQGFSGGLTQDFPTPTYDCSWAVDVSNYSLALTPSPNQYYSGAPKGEGIAEYITNAEYARGKQANGGGGGNNHNTGGAGGANYGTGGNGGMRSNEGTFYCHGKYPGIGGLSLSANGYSPAQNRIFLGGGGGCGHMNNLRGIPGGNGGGIVLLIASHIKGYGSSILAGGSRGYNPYCNDPYQSEGDGAGGGGAGGTVLLAAPSFSGSLQVDVQGANGANSSHKATGTPVNECDGPGGGGGGGVVWLAGTTVPAGISSFTNGGANGVISNYCGIVACRGQANGATAGGNGITLTGYTVPVGSVSFCSPLALNELLYFRASPSDQEIRLQWGIRTGRPISHFIVEYSGDHLHFTPLQSIPAGKQSSVYTASDRENFAGIRYYRLRVYFADGTYEYSSSVTVKRHASEPGQWTSMYPNPAQDRVHCSISCQEAGIGSWNLYDGMGQLLQHWEVSLLPGLNRVTLALQPSTAGLYWLQFTHNRKTETRKLIRSQ